FHPRADLLMPLEERLVGDPVEIIERVQLGLLARKSSALERARAAEYLDRLLEPGIVPQQVAEENVPAQKSGVEPDRLARGMLGVRQAVELHERGRVVVPGTGVVGPVPKSKLEQRCGLGKVTFGIVQIRQHDIRVGEIGLELQRSPQMALGRGKLSPEKPELAEVVMRV